MDAVKPLRKWKTKATQVLDAFPPSELAKDLRDLDLCNDALSLQRSICLLWDIDTDQFTFRTSREDKPLSVINGLFNPIGFTAPVVLRYERHVILYNLLHVMG